MLETQAVPFDNRSQSFKEVLNVSSTQRGDIHFVPEGAMQVIFHLWSSLLFSGVASV